MPATRPPRPVRPTLLSLCALLPGLAITLGMLALTACSPAVNDPTPRLLTAQELRTGIEDARTAQPALTGDIEGRAAALRGRAASLRRQPAAPHDDTDALRQRARALTTPLP